MAVRNTRLMTAAELAAALRRMADVVEANDSFEGRISYTCMNPEEHTEEELRGGKFEVNAFYRVGNSMGQGGSESTMRIVKS